MKLLRAEFTNFRLLRDLKLEFSSDREEKLTVIRAANESGKTTILHALQWALYGDNALPGKGENFRLHPVDWDTTDGKLVSITAIVEFETSHSRIASGEVHETRRHYRLIRSVNEEVDSQAHRPPSTVKLFEMEDTGMKNIESPEVRINDELPPELREIFFTDGDRALSFIEADVASSIKRRRVQSAIRSLLGLSVIEDAIKHVSKSAAEVNKKTREISSKNELTKVSLKLENIGENLSKLNDDIENAKQQVENLDERINKNDKNISIALQKGDKEELRKNINNIKSKIERLETEKDNANKDHSELFRSRTIATNLIAPLLGRAYEKLKVLHDQGKIPNTIIPVLEDRLSVNICICGETLESGDPVGEERRAHIQKLIDDSQRADQVQAIITELFYDRGYLQIDGDDENRTWLEDYKKITRRRDDVKKQRENSGQELRSLELQLDKLPDTDIQGLLGMNRQYKEQHKVFLSKQITDETKRDAFQRDQKELERKRDQLLRKEKKGAHILAEVDVTKDVMHILNTAYERITNEELSKVSNLMNNIFIKMIGADPQQDAIIQRAEISPEFDIIVYGPKSRRLNPDRDLNGASRRALTFSFILALTKISGVEAPNVIDTPLGMTSGYVKRAILETAVHESAQLVLFLTHDEIAGCEDIIDKTAGEIFTLTNSAHYPKMLVNDPGIVKDKILRCECGYQSECQLCQRHVTAQAE